MVDPTAWIILRAVYGICFAGLVLGIESWLNSASELETRGRILGAYTLVQLTVMTVGMQFVGMTPVSGFELFALSSILISLATLPIALTNTIAPVPPKRVKLRLGWLIAVSPSATANAVLAGIIVGAFLSLSPLFAQAAGFSPTGIATFLSVALLAGALAQWPVGTASDRLGRRPFVGLTGFVAGVSSLALYLLADLGHFAMFTLAFAFGAASMPIYTLILAHANDLVSKRRAVSVSGGLLLLYSAGAAVGPLLASLAMDIGGHAALFIIIGTACFCVTAVTYTRIQVRPRISKRHHEDFVIVPRTTPAVFQMDPRTDVPAVTPTPELVSSTEEPLHAVPEVIAPDGELPADYEPKIEPREHVGVA